jgi:hypothetical protein
MEILLLNFKIKMASIFMCLILVFSTHSSYAQTITNNTQGNHDGYFYSFWNDNSQGSASMTLGQGGNYSTTWNNVGNFTAGKGWAVGKPDRVVCFSGSYDGGSNGFLALYGWTKNSLIEYYVCETHGAWTPPGNTSDIVYKGSYTSDGGTYKIYTATRTNQPSIVGTATFQQFWSVRTEKRTSGTITFANHVAAWQAAGMTLGTTWDYQIMESEGYHSTGSSNITVSECPSNGASPTLTLTTNNTTYAIGATASLSANATDSDGSITKVEFFNDNTLLNTSTTPTTGSTYTYNWTNLMEGYYNITAVATDNVGNKTTSAIKTITVGNPKTELISNGELNNGTTGWTLQNNSGATGSMSVATNGNLSGTNSLRICPSNNPGTLDWHVQVSQTTPIVTNKVYTITFIGKADANRPITITIQQAGSPYTTYFGQSINLTTTAQTYSLTYVSTATDATALFKIYAGSNSSCLNIDKISMTESNSVTTNTQTLQSMFATVYPIPSNTELFVNTEMDLSNASFTAINSTGEETILNASVNTTGAVINVSSLSEGAYVLIITNATSVIRKKISITR